jgi:hypothetical protein
MTLNPLIILFFLELLLRPFAFWSSRPAFRYNLFAPPPRSVKDFPSLRSVKDFASLRYG